MHFGSDASTLSVADYAQQWLERRKIETSLATHRRYQNGIDKWLEFLGLNADRGLERLPRCKCSHFAMHAQRPAPQTPRTWN